MSSLNTGRVRRSVDIVFMQPTIGKTARTKILFRVLARFVSDTPYWDCIYVDST